MSDSGDFNQAHQMLDRVSPEGRARALKEQRRRQAATNRLILRCVLAGMVVAVVTALIGLAIPLGTPAIAAALAVWAIACVAIGMMSRERTATPDGFAESKLQQLPDQAGRWLEGQRPALPAPAMRIADDIVARLEGMAPQLAKLGPDEPAADAVRKLLSTELPNLVTGYHAVPPSLRDRAGNGGQSADSHLVEGLTVIDGEIARMTEQLARGAFDEVATQRRYLELKYEGEGSLSSS
jgi:hypothetical protein